jgi:hypothetical protein
MSGWVKPIVILGALAVLIAGSILEFRTKRRDDRPMIQALEQTSPQDRLACKQYLQTQNVEQLLHVVVTTLVAILVALLWP